MTDKPKAPAPIPITIHRRFHQEKLVEYMGKMFYVPKDTTFMAMEPYASSYDAMVVAFPEEPTYDIMGTWHGAAKKCVAVVTPGDKAPIQISLQKVE